MTDTPNESTTDQLIYLRVKKPPKALRMPEESYGFDIYRIEEWRSIKDRMYSGSGKTATTQILAYRLALMRKPPKRVPVSTCDKITLPFDYTLLPPFGGRARRATWDSAEKFSRMADFVAGKVIDVPSANPLASELDVSWANYEPQSPPGTTDFRTERRTNVKIQFKGPRS